MHATPLTTPHPVPRWQWGAALLMGTLLWFVGLIASEVIPQVLLGMELEGPTYALVGVIRAALGLAAIVVALRIVTLRLRDVGLVTTQWRNDAVLGAAIAIGFALLQFVVIIPNTGGAARSDIVANAAQIGTSPWGVFGFIVLAWTGAFSEELFFRGHFFTTLTHTPCEMVGAPMDIDGTIITVGASIGIAVYPEDAMSSAALLKCADLAMYVAKREQTCVMRHTAFTQGAVAVVTFGASAPLGPTSRES